ncbi:MAG TPA: hypothetical protein DCW31_05260 [Lactobacillus sp.]|nr:hypothetical protein [Lactobacillus sp.]
MDKNKQQKSLDTGTLIRRLRLARRLTQKEVYEGIVSRSFYGRLEHGQYDVDSNHLWQLIDRLDISLLEFDYLRRNGNMRSTDNLQYAITTLYEQRKFTKLQELYAANKSSKSNARRLLASQAYILVRAYGSNITQMPLEPCLPAVTHLKELSQWSLFDLQLAGLAIWSVQDLTEKRGLVMKGETCYKQYAKLTTSDAAMLREQLWLNYLQDLLTRPTYVPKARFSDAKDVWQEIQNMPNDNTDYTCRLIRKTSLVIGALYFAKQPQVAIQQAEQLLSVFRMINEPSFQGQTSTEEEIITFQLHRAAEYHRYHQL